MAENSPSKKAHEEVYEKSKEKKGQTVSTEFAQPLVIFVVARGFTSKTLVLLVKELGT